MRRACAYASAPDPAFIATTASEIAVMAAVGSRGSSKASSGTRRKPPPAPTSVPNVPIPTPMHSSRRGESAAPSAGDPTLHLDCGHARVGPVGQRDRRHESRVDRALPRCVGEGTARSRERWRGQPLLDFALTLSNTRAILITAGALIDGSGEAARRPGAVLIEGDRIGAVGTRIDAPTDAERIDLPNATITPGLIDCHIHLSDAGLADASVQDHDPSGLRILRMAEHARRTLMAGFTTVRDAGGR